MDKKLTLKDLAIKDKRVLMRVDFNVPLDEKGAIVDDTRIKASLPSISYLLDRGACVILMSHLGRPDGVAMPAYSLSVCARRLSELLLREVLFAKDCIGLEVKKMVSNLKPGDVLLLENVRFHSAEEKGDASFAKELAELGDFYVNDAFGSAHRAHASTTTIAQFFPGKAAAGFLMEKEISFLKGLLQDPKRPFLAIIGGAKISTKIGALKALLKRVDTLIIGGAMAYTFIKAQGGAIGGSLCEDKYLKVAKELLAESKSLGVKLILPIDSVVTDNIVKESATEIVDIENGIPEGFKGADIGPKSLALFKEAIDKAKTIFWNGPLGVFEIDNFAKGTYGIAKAFASSLATTVVGGGDTIAAMESAGVAKEITHISTGGGASLEFLENGSLPGIEALSTAKG